MKQKIASVVWWLSEFTGIGLGRLAPTMLGWKFGKKVTFKRIR